MENFSTKIDSEGRTRVSIRLRRYGGLGSEDIDFKVDTGADDSSISRVDLNTLGYTDEVIDSSLQFYCKGTLADGKCLDWFSINLNLNNIMGLIMPKGLQYSFVCVNKVNVPKPYLCRKDCELTGDIYGGFNSLLGNDILSCFNITIDRTKGEMTFGRISDIDVRNRKYPNREMHELCIDNGSTKKMPLSIEEKRIINIASIEDGFNIDNSGYYVLNPSVPTTLSQVEGLIQKGYLRKDENGIYKLK